MKTFFGTDGVRGIAGRAPLDKTTIKRLGAAAAAVYRRQVKNRRPVFWLGRDTRQSGSWIAETFARGAASQGVEIRDVGITSTPSLAYLVPARRAMGGVMVSASHNPAEFNGIKLFAPNGGKCPDAWEHQIEQVMGELPNLDGRARALKRDTKAVADYLAFLKRTIPSGKPLKGLRLVVDCSHGSLSRIAPGFLRRLGAHVTAIGAAPNGRNINAGVGSQHTEKMRREVLARRAHGGLAFDGDADRIILCDEFGRVLDGDHVIACAAHILKQERRLPGNAVVVTVMANLGLFKALEAWKVKTWTTPVGDRYVSEKLDACGGALGGEQSGHIIFHRYLPTGDGLLTGLQILAMLRRWNKPFSWMHSLMRKYPQVLQNVRVKYKKPLEDCNGLQSAIRAAERELGSNGRVLVRYSGTEPLLRVMMEGPSEPRLKELAQRISEEAVKTLGHG